MTDLLRRPTEDAAEPGRSGSYALAWAPALAAASAAVAGLLVVAAVVLIAWGAEAGNDGSATTALRTAGQVWLFAHHSTLRTGTGTLGLVPLGLLAVPLALLVQAGRFAARRAAVHNVGDAACAVGVLAGTYAVIAAAVGVLTRGSGTLVDPVYAAAAGLVVAALAGSIGVIREAGLGSALTGRIPAAGPVVARAGLVAATTMLAGGALLVAGALAVHSGRMLALTRGLGPGVVGEILLLLLAVLFAPNAAVCAAAYLAGPGFAVGTGTSVSVLGVTLGPVPAFPLLAALPQGAGSDLRWLGAVVPLAAGSLAGALVVRRLAGVSRLRLVGWAAVTGPVAGAVLAVLAALAGGAVGDGRLTAVGPSPWQVGVAVTTEVAVIAVVAALALRWRQGRGEAVDRLAGASR